MPGISLRAGGDCPVGTGVTVDRGTHNVVCGLLAPWRGRAGADVHRLLVSFLPSLRSDKNGVLEEGGAGEESGTLLCVCVLGAALGRRPAPSGPGILMS